MISPTDNRAEPIAFVGTSDLAGHFRGKGFVLAQLENRIRFGMGLSPSNIMLSALGPIHDTPFGTAGELALKPDPATRIEIHSEQSASPLIFFLGDITTLEGEHWACCPRHFLRRGLDALIQACGLRALAAFEQEFVYTGTGARAGLSYTFDAFRRASEYGARVLGVLHENGIMPETFVAEYAPRQYEICMERAIGLRAADEAVISREVIRTVAGEFGHRAILAPILEPNGIGNGTHIHVSLLDSDSNPVLYDASSKFELSATGRSFAAGIVQHLPAICAITAPSIASYYRLKPGKWAPTAPDIGLLDRGAAIRLCGGYAKEPERRARQLNIEFRVADAAASPYLVLGALVHAGLDGIQRGLELPDAGRIPGARLPQDLPAALDLFERSATVQGWLGETLANAYLRLKRGEIRALDRLSRGQICQRYVEAY